MEALHFFGLEPEGAGKETGNDPRDDNECKDELELLVVKTPPAVEDVVWEFEPDFFVELAADEVVAPG